MSLSEKLARFDAQSDNMGNASKEAWECESYAEWIASLPENEQPQAEDYN